MAPFTLAAFDGVDHEEFADICITSGTKFSIDEVPADAFALDEVLGVAVVFAKTEGEKCQRYWKTLPDVGQHGHPGVCERCNDALGQLSDDPTRAGR